MSTRARTTSTPSSTPAQAHAAEGTRAPALDALRGAALVWMAIFHFCFDLSHYGLLRANFYEDAWWTTQRTCILSLFLLCAGAGQAMAVAERQTWARFWRRWRQIAGCALLVSAGSYLMFPDSYIYFGVLHGMALMLILARLGAGLGMWLPVVGSVIIYLPQAVQSTFFDTRSTDWVGLVTHKPITEDYVPLMPWLGVILWGLWGMQLLLRHRPQALRITLPRMLRPLGLLGRWSLTFYMTHQLVLIGGLELFMMWRRAR
jgi:uncharacterized membrane protein